MAELIQCPFCGRIPTVEDCGTNRWFVRCKCGIAQDKLYHQRCDAVRAWNRRKPGIIKDSSSVQSQSCQNHTQKSPESDTFGVKTGETCSDTISRKAAIDAAKHAWAKGLEPSQYIEDLPSVQTEQQELITWLLDEIWDDDAWELNYGAFPEILCRKLVKLGYVAEEGGMYVRIDKPKGGN